MRKIYILVCLILGFSSRAVLADETMSVVFEEIKNHYVEPVSVQKLALEVMNGFNEIDNRLQVANEPSRFTLYYNTKVFRNFNKFESDDVKTWVDLLNKMIEEFTQVSPKFETRDFEIIDALVKSVIKSLDADSKYYTAFDLADDEAYKRKLNFASRKIEDILYVKIANFSDEVANEFEKLLSEEKTTKALILDLRGNSGGDLASMVKIADLLLDGGIMFETQSRDADMNKMYEANEGEAFEGKPIAVLVDAKTASSAELLAGCLQEQSRAILLGTTTFGKATTQKAIKLPNDSVFLMTNAYLRLPSEKNFAKIGIMPDFCMSGSEASGDICPKEDRSGFEMDIEKAVSLLKERI